MSPPLPIPRSAASDLATNHVEQAKKWAAIISLIGGAIVSLIINYQQQRAAMQRQAAPAREPEPKVVLEAPVINPAGSVTAPNR